MAKRGRKDVHQGDVLGLSDADPHVKIPTPIYRGGPKDEARKTGPDPAGATAVRPEWTKPETAEPAQADQKP